MWMIITSLVLLAVLTALFGVRGLIVGLVQFVTVTFSVLWNTIKVIDIILTICDVLGMIFDLLNLIFGLLSLIP